MPNYWISFVCAPLLFANIKVAGIGRARFVSQVSLVTVLGIKSGQCVFHFMHGAENYKALEMVRLRFDILEPKDTVPLLHYPKIESTVAALAWPRFRLMCSQIPWAWWPRPPPPLAYLKRITLKENAGHV